MTRFNITGVGMGGGDILFKTSAIVKSVPVSVKSSNLLRYGATSFGGMNIAVNDDGSLHVTGQLDANSKFIYYDMPLTDIGLTPGDTVSFSAGNSMKDLTVGLIAPRPNMASQSIGENTVIDAAVTELRLRIYARKSSVDVTIKPMLNHGSTVLPWMRPDDISYEGGG